MDKPLNALRHLQVSVGDNVMMMVAVIAGAEGEARIMKAVGSTVEVSLMSISGVTTRINARTLMSTPLEEQERTRREHPPRTITPQERANNRHHPRKQKRRHRQESRQRKRNHSTAP